MPRRRERRLSTDRQVQAAKPPAAGKDRAHKGSQGRQGLCASRDLDRAQELGYWAFMHSWSSEDLTNVVPQL